ncbi:ankyrin repeat-containing domain protein [Halenospora varia]|nr:ankyrin repeat-containing domain protein [Halenospora varia]
MEKHSMDKDSIDSLLDEKDSYSKESYKPIKFKKARKSWRLSSLASRILCPLHLPALKLPQLQKKKDVPLILPAVSDKPDSEGRLPIHHAALLGDAKIIRDLNSSLNIEDATNLGWRPIHLAAMGDHVDVAVVLKDLGAKLDAKSKHPVGSANTGFITHFPITALQLSLIKGNQGIAKFLLEDGADYEVMGPMGQGLLHYAAHSGSKEVFLDLVGKGLDPFQKDGNHLLPFHWAACENRVEICKEYIRLCKNRGMSLDIEQNHGETPMGCALRRGHAETAKLLLEAGADPHHRNAVGHTTLMFAPFAKDNGLLNSIVSAGADVNVGDYMDKITALHVACAKKNAEAVKVLVEQGADINAMTSDGWTPLMVAIDYHSVDVTSYLLSQGANVGLEDKFGFSAFEYCGGYAPIVELLEPYRKEFYELQRIVRIPDKTRFFKVQQHCKRSKEA